MQLVLSNGYRHAVDEVLPRSITRRVETNPGGQRTSMTVAWTLEGYLHAADQASLTIAMRTLESAYANDGFAAVFLDNSGQNSAHHIGGNGSRRGCRVIGGVNWLWNNGAEYTTYRSYQIQLEADYDNPFAQIWLFHESISRKGNTGPRKIWKPSLNSSPQRQITYPQTIQRVVQRGVVIGMYDYVAPPPPLWPAYIDNEEEEEDQDTPKRYGPIAAPYYREFETRYAYFYKSDIPLIGRPNKWI